MLLVGVFWSFDGNSQDHIAVNKSAHFQRAKVALFPLDSHWIKIKNKASRT